MEKLMQIGLLQILCNYKCPYIFNNIRPKKVLKMAKKLPKTLENGKILRKLTFDFFLSIKPNNSI